MPASALPFALARVTDTIEAGIPAGRRRWEAKWDGWRAQYERGRLWSRRGSDLTRLFPDLAPVIEARLPGGVHLDGEIVCWNAETGRLDFGSLARRVTAGHRIAQVASAQPAHYVAFDLLVDEDGADVRPLPLSRRREMLEHLMSGVGAPLALCEQTDEIEIAQTWFEQLAAAGIEGLVVKDSAAPYPSRSGQRVWAKLKSRAELDLVVTAVTGDPSAPDVLVLARPGEGGALHSSATNSRLTRAQAREFGRLLTPIGVQTRRVGWPGNAAEQQVTVILPLVVEVHADAASDAGAYRHAVRLIRARPDLVIDDLIP